MQHLRHTHTHTHTQARTRARAHTHANTSPRLRASKENRARDRQALRTGDNRGARAGDGEAGHAATRHPATPGAPARNSAPGITNAPQLGGAARRKGRVRETREGLGDEDAAVGLVGKRILVAVVGNDLDMGLLFGVVRERRARVRHREGEGLEHVCARGLCHHTHPCLPRTPHPHWRARPQARTHAHTRRSPSVERGEHIACVRARVRVCWQRAYPWVRSTHCTRTRARIRTQAPPRPGCGIPQRISRNGGATNG